MQNSFTCIIVDDEYDAIQLLTRRLNKLYKNITVTHSFLDWEQALSGLKEHSADIVFMDISMPDKNGISLLKLIPNLDSEIIFVTAHEEYAIEAFNFSTSGYILKPVDDEELFTAVNKAMERVSIKRLAKQANAGAAPAAAPLRNDKIAVPGNQGIDYINIDDILYLESANKCTKIVTAKREYISSQNLGKFLNLPDTQPFFHVHRSYIINLNCILRYESSGVVIMSNMHEIPVSRNVKGEFLKMFNNSY